MASALVGGAIADRMDRRRLVLLAQIGLVTTAAGAAGVRFSVISGGLACLAGVGFVLLAVPALVRYDADQWTGAPAQSRA